MVHVWQVIATVVQTVWVEWQLLCGLPTCVSSAPWTSTWGCPCCVALARDKQLWLSPVQRLQLGWGAPESRPSAGSLPTSRGWQAHGEKERLEDPQKVQCGRNDKGHIWWRPRGASCSPKENRWDPGVLALCRDLCGRKSLHHASSNQCGPHQSCKHATCRSSCPEARCPCNADISSPFQSPGHWHQTMGAVRRFQGICLVPLGWCVSLGLWLARPHGPESHHRFPRNCGYSESLTPQFCCQILQSFRCQCPHPHPWGLCLHSHPCFLHWFHCHPGRWTCCLHRTDPAGGFSSAVWELWLDAELEWDLTMLVSRDGVPGQELAGNWWATEPASEATLLGLGSLKPAPPWMHASLQDRRLVARA